MSFIEDVKGAVGAGRFYHDTLARPMKQAWLYLIKLLAVISLLSSAFWSVKFFDLYNETIDFFEENIKKVEIVNGEIVNMPLSHQRLLFKERSIHVDSLYVDEEAIADDLSQDTLAALFVGPKKAFLITDKDPIVFDYPTGYSGTLETDYLRGVKIYLFPAIALAVFVVFILYRFVSALFYALLIITPIVLFKFRRAGLPFKAGFQAGLYLASLQVIIATLLMFLNIQVPWAFLWFIFFYILYVGALVNIDVTKRGDPKSEIVHTRRQ